MAKETPPRITRILVDGDSFPSALRKVIARYSTLLAPPQGGDSGGTANGPIRLYVHQQTNIPPTPGVTVIHSPDSDREIIADTCSTDLIITRDLQLAGRLAGTAATIIDPCGRVLTGTNLSDRLARSTAAPPPGAPRQGALHRHRRDFINRLQQLLGN